MIWKHRKNFLVKYGICSDTTIGIEGDKKLTELLDEYADHRLRAAGRTLSPQYPEHDPCNSE